MHKTSWHMELLDVLLDRFTRRSSQFTEPLFAGALRIEAKNLSDPAHKNCFIGHGRCWFLHPTSPFFTSKTITGYSF